MTTTTTDERGLRLHDLTVGHRVRGSFGRRRAQAVLTGLRAQARPGELTVLLGPNGAGKSTILRTVCGLQPSLAGSVTVAGRDVARTRPGELARLLAAVLTDRVDAGLLTAREVVALGRHPHTAAGGRLTSADRNAVERALADTGATGLAHRQLAELSDGERQRVLTARALAQDPDTIVLDEPTAFLDVPSKVALNLLLRDLARRGGRTVLATTHDLELALRVADHVWLVGRDAALHTGAPEDLVLSGALGAAFDTPHLAFDAALGAFTLRQDALARVRLNAPDELAPILTRALAREGIAVTDTDGELAVTATEWGHYQVRHREAASVVHTTVAELLRHLRTTVPSRGEKPATRPTTDDAPSSRRKEPVP
ncbi:MAG TPA: ABC transporter ATP-binding protein [Yinghuangia sp.]|nr:ABC transporter ATP-binding protein [Yinghuangia sp.]